MYRVVIEYENGSFDEIYTTSLSEAYEYQEEAEDNGDSAYIETV